MPDARLTTTAPIVSVLAGGVAGGVESLVTYPFEFAKTRIQLYNDSKVRLSRNPYRIVGQLYREEGLRALYKGCGVSIVGSIGKDAVRFASFDMVKNAFRDPETGTLTPGRNLLAGMSAGVVSLTFAVLEKTRLTVQVCKHFCRDPLRTHQDRPHRRCSVEPKIREHFARS